MTTTFWIFLGYIISVLIAAAVFGKWFYNKTESGDAFVWPLVLLTWLVRFIYEKI